MYIRKNKTNIDYRVLNITKRLCRVGYCAPDTSYFHKVKITFYKIIIFLYEVHFSRSFSKRFKEIKIRTKLKLFDKDR